MAKKSGKRAKLPPKKTYDLITQDTKEGAEIHDLVAATIKKYKKDLADAHVGAAWMIGRKPDRDGRIVLGRMKKTTELERQLHGLDAIVILNQAYWRTFNKAQRSALVHHELCHLAPSMGADGIEQAIDGHGALRWRIVKHDLEEFREVVERHGCYLADIAAFGRAILTRDPNLNLFDDDPKASGPKAVPSPKPVAATG
jgi:hypothetical protein